MACNEPMELFRKTSTTLVYIASKEFSQKLMGKNQQRTPMLYIHVSVEYGNVIVYEDNDVNKRIPLESEDYEFIQKYARADRDSLLDSE
jgi:hypothetical protein